MTISVSVPYIKFHSVMSLNYVICIPNCYKLIVLPSAINKKVKLNARSHNNSQLYNNVETIVQQLYFLVRYV